MNNKVFAIVGIGPGLGLGLAQRFAREGYHIAMVARSQDAMDECAKSIVPLGVKAESFVADASSSEALVAAFAGIRERLGAPSVLVYNAAIMRQALPTAIAPEDLVSEFRVNVVGALVSAQAVVPAMRQNQRGTILLTGGGLALTPAPQFASLGIGKAAIRNLTQSLASELERDGIHVATVTIRGFIKPGTSFDPKDIAEVYWKLHEQPKGAWDREYIYEHIPK